MSRPMAETPREYGWSERPLGAIVASLWPVLMVIGLAWLAHVYTSWSLAHRDASGAMDPFHVKMLRMILINVIMAVSLNIVNGFTGQFSLGHAGFMAVGGYVAGSVTYYGSWLIWENPEVHGGIIGSGSLLFLTALVAGGIAAAGTGWLVGLPSLRLRGDYLAIVTLGFGEIVRVVFTKTRDVKFIPSEIKEASLGELAVSMGGALGFDGIPKYTNVFWVSLIAMLTILISYRLKESIHGRAFIAIREDEIAAEAMGVPTTRTKVQAFVIAAFFAGVGGGLYAHEVGVLITPQELNFQRSIDFVIMVVLGGMGSISGVVLAAIALTILPELLRNLSWVPGLPPAMHNISDYRMIIYALLLIVVMIVRPQGLFGIREIWNIAPVTRLVDRWSRRGGTA